MFESTTRFILVFLFLFFLLLFSCTKDKGTLFKETGNLIGYCDSANVTFTNTIQPIINNRCGGCHSVSTYNLAKARVGDGSIIMTNAMPQGAPMPDEEKRKIQCWIDKGSPNN